MDNDPKHTTKKDMMSAASDGLTSTTTWCKTNDMKMIMKLVGRIPIVCIAVKAKGGYSEESKKKQQHIFGFVYTVLAY